MAYDKPLKKVGNIPVPQYWNEDIGDWEVVQGSGGSYRMSAPIKLAKEPFSGSANLTKEFASEMSGFVISNDGNADLTFTIGGDTYLVKAGEVFEEEFAPFTTVTIASTVAFRAYGKVTVGGAVVVQPTPDPDITAPDNVTNLSASSITQNSLTLNWTASASSDTVGYDVYRGSTLLGTVTGTNYNVSGLTASTQYTFIVKAKDGAGNIASGTSIPATTIAQPTDTTPPANATNLTPSNLTATGFTLTWTASVASDIKDYNVYNGATLIATVTGVTYNVTGLTASTAYTFTVKARDTANNEATGAQVDVTTAAPADTTAPVITATPAAGTFTSTQSVTLSSNEGGTTIYYTTDGSTPTTSSTQYSSAIAINATTTLKYFGRDAAGNSSSVQTATYTINLADTTAPNPVTGLSAGTPTGNSVPLTWTISSSGDVATQEVAYSTDGTNFTVASAVVNAASTSYTVTGLSASTAYTFRVVAVDGASNRSTAVTTTATTAAAPSLTVINSDSFNRADSTTTLGSTDAANGGTSKAWQALSGTWGISGNAAYLAVASADAVAVVDEGISDNFTLTATTSVYGATVQRVVWRCVDANNYFMIQGTTVWKKAGTLTNLGTVTGTRANGDVIKVVVSGNTHTIFINGTQAGQFTDAAHNTGTKHGFGVNSSTTAKFDNYKFEQ